MAYVAIVESVPTHLDMDVEHNVFAGHYCTVVQLSRPSGSVLFETIYVRSRTISGKWHVISAKNEHNANYDISAGRVVA
jgi:hypothetical protein